MANILLTGATGFIGSRLALYLADRGYDCTCLVRDMTVLTTRHDTLPLLRQDHIEWVQGDLDDTGQLDDIMGACRPDIILHVAGLTPHTQPQDPSEYDRVNVKASQTLLEAAISASQTHGIAPKFIYASTVAVYGAPQLNDGIVREDDITAPASPYARSKAGFEDILRGQTDIPYAILRYANIPGRDSFINLCLGKRQVTLLGSEPFVRDYIHMDDLADLHEKTINYLQNGGRSVTLNAGAGIGSYFPDIVHEVARQTGKPVEVVRGIAGKNDIPRLICDINNAKNVLGWTPQKTTLHDIVSYAIDNHERPSQKMFRHSDVDHGTYRP